MRGYCGIGVENLKFSNNLGILFRSAFCFNANFIFTIGHRYKYKPTDTFKTFRHIPLFQYEDDNHFLKSIPKDCDLIGVEISPTSQYIYDFQHPQRAIYILGAEDNSVSIQDKCKTIIQIPTSYCLNVAMAATIVLYDRNKKASLDKLGRDPLNRFW